MRRNFIIVSLAVLFGWIAGPIMYAALAALSPGERSYGTNVEIVRLLDVYRANLRSHFLFRSIASHPDGRECGYEPEEIMPDQIWAMGDARKEEFNAYEGYYALNRWIGQQKDEAYISRIGENILSRVSQYEIQFLRRCIESTVLSPVCMNRVSSFASGVQRFPEKDETDEFYFVGGQDEKIICLYLDGVAARKGLVLANPED